MKIEKDGDGWMIDLSIRRPDGGRYRIRRKVYGSRRDAAKWAAEIKNAGKVGRLIAPEDPMAPPDPEAPKPLPFDTFAWEWFETYVKANNKPSEVKGKEVILRRHLVPFFQNQDLRSIRALDVERFKATKLLDVSAKTVNNMLTCLKKLYSSALEWELIEKNPLARVKKMKTMDYEWDFLTREESDALLAALDEHWRPFFATAIYTGLRLGELLALKWDDLSWRSEKLLVRRSLYRKKFVAPKSGKSREVPMNSKLVALLRSSRHLKGDLVFSSQSGNPLDPSNVKKPFFAALKRAGLRKIRFHDLRHSFASQLVSASVPLKVVQELLGHASITMTLRYAHLAPGVTKSAVEVLCGAASGAKPGQKVDG